MTMIDLTSPIARPRAITTTNPDSIPATGTRPVTTDAIITEYEDFGPYNHFVVTNKSTEIIKASLDGDPNRSWQLQPNEQMVSDADDRFQFRTMVIENQDASNAIAADEVVVTYLRKPLHGQL